MAYRAVSEPYRLAIVVSHPIQYFVPLYRRLAFESWIDLTVFYTRPDLAERHYDDGFGRQVKWDIDLLSGYRYEFLDNWGFGSGFLSSINPAVMATLRRSKFDAVLVHGHQYVTYVLAIVAAKLRGVRVILRTDSHLGLPRSTLRRLNRTLVVAPLYRWCDVAAAAGKLNAEFYRHLGFRDDRIVLAPYSVDNDFFAELATAARPGRDDWRRRRGIGTETPVVMYAAKLTDIKRPFDLLEAFRLVRSRGVTCAVVFVGSGELESQLKTAAEGLPDVHFVGFLNQSELPKMFAMADVFVLTSSHHESFGLVVNEAMASGLPVVVSAGVGAVPDLVIEGHTGYSYPMGDVAALADCLVETITPQALARLSKGAKRRVDEWTVDHTARGLKEALARAVDGSSH